MVFFVEKTKLEVKELFVNLIASINKSSLKYVRTFVKRNAENELFVFELKKINRKLFKVAFQF